MKTGTISSSPRPGTYRVVFEVDGYVIQYYDGAGDIDHATTVSVGEAPVLGIDAVAPTGRVDQGAGRPERCLRKQG